MSMLLCFAEDPTLCKLGDPALFRLFLRIVKVQCQLLDVNHRDKATTKEMDRYTPRLSRVRDKPLNVIYVREHVKSKKETGARHN